MKVKQRVQARVLFLLSLQYMQSHRGVCPRHNSVIQLLLYVYTFYVLQHGVAIFAFIATSRNETFEANLAKAS